MTSSSPLSSSSLETFYFVMNMALQEGLEYKDIEHHLEQEISQRAENLKVQQDMDKNTKEILKEKICETVERLQVCTPGQQHLFIRDQNRDCSVIRRKLPRMLKKLRKRSWIAISQSRRRNGIVNRFSRHILVLPTIHL